MLNRKIAMLRKCFTWNISLLIYFYLPYEVFIDDNHKILWQYIMLRFFFHKKYYFLIIFWEMKAVIYLKLLSYVSVINTTYMLIMLSYLKYVQTVWKMSLHFKEHEDYVLTKYFLLHIYSILTDFSKDIFFSDFFVYLILSFVLLIGKYYRSSESTYWHKLFQNNFDDYKLSIYLTGECI